MGWVEKENFRTKIKLMVVEKLILALLIAIAGFVFNYLLQKEKTRGDYQKQMFDRRVQSYITILEEAKKARDGLALLYGASHFGYDNLGELAHKEQLDDLLQQSSSLDSSCGHTSRGYHYSHTPVLESLANIEQIARDNDLYFTQQVKEQVDNFLRVAIGDLPQSLEITKQEMEAFQAGESIDPEVSTANETFRQAAWQRVDEAYQMLLDEIRNSLQVEGIPLG